MSGANFRSISDGYSLENTPRHTNKNFSHQKLRQRLREEDDENERRDGEQPTDHGLAVAEPLRNDTVDEQARDLADQRAVAEAGLPGRGELVRAVGLELAELLLEDGVRVEVVEQGLVEALHDDAGAEEDGPRDGLGVQLDRLQEAHVVLGLGRGGGFGGDSGHVGAAAHRGRGLELGIDGLGRGGGEADHCVKFRAKMFALGEVEVKKDPGSIYWRVELVGMNAMASWMYSSLLCFDRDEANSAGCIKSSFELGHPVVLYPPGM